jgi:glycosyltransferase involved in cell wall biosynthesis
MLSVVIPVYNEAENLSPLYEDVTDALLGLQEPFEILFVDDGSSDRSPEILRELAAKEDSIKVIRFRRNFGQTAAMMAGIDHASGEVIVVMDSDGQNDPADIPALLDKLAEGYDVVSGWRRKRRDKRGRIWLSRIANRLISWTSGVRLHDYGCSLKAYRRDVIQSVRLYGEMHRFIPVYAERIIKVFLDLLVVQFLGRYETRPMYIFGGFGLVSWGISLASAGYAFYRKWFEDVSFILTPLPLLSVMAFITGVLSILMGLLAELLVRTYYESQQKPPYAIKNTLNLDADA